MLALSFQGRNSQILKLAGFYVHRVAISLTRSACLRFCRISTSVIVSRPPTMESPPTLSASPSFPKSQLPQTLRLISIWAWPMGEKATLSPRLS